jgi:malate dehydrogenase (quinone)
MSYVKGDKDVSFLRRRYDALSREPLFAGLEYTEDLERIGEWAPLMMRGRKTSAPMAFTRHEGGTDVNFGELTRQLVASLDRNGSEIATNHDVVGLDKQPDGRWKVHVKDRLSGEQWTVTTRFVFIGAGGRAILLLQQSGIPEAKGYGGFPVSGQFIRSTNPALIAGHHAKVYGKSQQKAPPMAMPHLDTRVIDGKEGLLFGPYAGFSPKFLKQGSIFDLLRSVKPDNILTMLNVAKNEFALTRYLIGQILQSNDARIETLRDFLPEAESGDWELIHAGMRVQTMKRTAKSRGALEFGTEVVSAKDGTIAGLLGASPGASTAVSIMLDVMRRCFPGEYPEWEPKLSQLIPSIGRTLNEDPVLLGEIQAMTDRTLQLGPAGHVVGAD